MKFLQKATAILILCIFCTGCAHRAGEQSIVRNDNNFNSTLWLQGSSEFKASALQTYNMASMNLKGITQAPAGTAAIEQSGDYMSLPPAVILDIDETVLSNSKYHAKLVLDAEEFNAKTWDQWISLKQATAVPGVVSFVTFAKSNGIKVIYITNRACKARQGIIDTCPQKADTLENLEKVGIKDVIPSDIMLKNEQKGWSSEKQSRRKIVAENYRIVMLFGDDLGDFLPQVKKNITPEQRARLVAEHDEKWGKVWYILANPAYGSWLSVRGKPQSQHLTDY